MLEPRLSHNDEHVFTGPRGGRLDPDIVLRTMKKKVLPSVAAELYPDSPEPELLRLKVHSLRHYFCTQCYRHGLAEHQIRDLLGHRDSGITQLYRHLSTIDHKSMIDRLPPAASVQATSPGADAEQNPEAHTREE